MLQITTENVADTGFQKVLMVPVQKSCRASLQLSCGCNAFSVARVLHHLRVPVYYILWHRVQVHFPGEHVRVV